MRRFVTHVVPEIPPLAYLSVVNAGSVVTYHGSGVHRTGQFLCDGVWAGPVSRPPRSVDFLAGTSIGLRDGAVHAMAGNNPTDRLYVLRVGSGWILSNSMSFLCAYTGSSLDLNHRHYRSFFASKTFGLRVGPREIPITGSRRVRVLLDEELLIDATGEAHFRSRPMVAGFKRFDDYDRFLLENVQAIVANATSPGRSHSYEPIVPLSTGYDSVATAAIAARVGVSEAVTMRRYATPDDPSTTLLDHPRRIADSLGLHLTEVERGQFLNRTDLPDAAVGAAMGNFIDMPLLNMEPHLRERTVLVGNSGDNVWSRGNFRAYRDVARGDTSGQGLGEWRLRANVMFVPVPYIGHTAHPDLKRLANSSAMRPWAVGGSYDRPIARRIAETAGVPREAFGIKKYAAGALVGSNQMRLSLSDLVVLERQLSTFLTRQGVSSYLAFLNLAPKISSFYEHIQGRGSWVFHKLDALNFRVGRRLHRYGIRGVVPRAAMAYLGSRLQVPLDAGCYLPHWGVEECKTDYPPKSRLQELGNR